MPVLGQEVFSTLGWNCELFEANTFSTWTMGLPVFYKKSGLPRVLVTNEDIKGTWLEDIDRIK